MECKAKATRHGILDDNDPHASTARRPSSSLDEDDNSSHHSETAQPPLKRRRRHSDPMSMASTTTSFATLHETPSTALARPEWEAFVRHGACLKSFLKDALERLKQAAISTSLPTHSEGLITGVTNSVGNDDNHEIEPNNSIMLHPKHSSELAREKTAQCMILEKKLIETEHHATTLTATSDALRDERHSTLSRLDKASTALRMAGQNAAQARADADAAEACAAVLASQLQALKTVVDETKQASQVLMEEHTQILATTQAMEAAYMTTQAELVKSQTQVRRGLDDKRELGRKIKELQETQAALNRMVRHQKEELQSLQLQLGEQEALEQARHHRMAQLEEELRNAQTLLTQATSTVAEQQGTLQSHQDSVRALQEENEHLFEQFAQQQAWSKVELDRLQTSWTKAEQERQSYRLQATASEEQVQRLLLEQSDKDQHILHLQQQVTQLERQMLHLNPQRDEDENGDRPSAHNRDLPFLSILPHTPKAGSELVKDVGSIATGNTPPSLHRCCICFKPPFGLMKSCQCVNAGCDKRAHSLCVHKSQAGPSVSHPGTPAPRLPLVLCSGNFATNKLATIAAAEFMPTTTPETTVKCNEGTTTNCIATSISGDIEDVDE